MKKQLLFVLLSVLAIAGAVTAATVVERTGKSIKKERTAPVRAIAKADAAKSPTIYGWLRYVEHAPSDQQYGVCRFNASDPETVDVLFPFDAEHQACAGAYANGVYYVYRYTPGDYAQPVDFGSVNLTTGEFTEIADYSRLNALFADMTFDYSTQTMYAIANIADASTSTLITVNLENGDVHNVAALDEKFVTLACSYDGQLYAVKGDDGYLYKIDKTNGDLTSIGYTYEEPAEYSQSMEFDHSTETLYWAANTIYEEGVLAVIDTESGESERTGYISENAQVVGLYIPFARTADKAPAAVENLVVTPAAEGELGATISWTNPTLTSDQKDNTTITRVDIYRENALVGTVTDAQPGEASQWTDTTVPASGKYTYRVTAVNNEGEGDPAETQAFIGHDIPTAPTAATVTKIDDVTIKIDWAAPTGGQNGGWVDQSTMRYTLTRQPDNVVVATNLAATTFTDVVNKLDSYSYVIEAQTADGIGGKATTDFISAGPAITVPYTCSFATEGEFALWTVIDNNDDYFTWERETTLAAAKYYANDDYETSADDWLISSPIALNVGKQYRLRFKAQSYDETYPEQLGVYLGQGKTIEAMTTLLSDNEVASYEMKQFEVMLPEITDDGSYNIGFYCHSVAPNGYILYVTDVELTEVNSGAFSGTVTSDGNPVEGATVSINDLKLTATTDAQGRFSFDEVEVGEHSVTITADGYATVDASVTIVAGGMATETYKLTKLRNVAISGRLVNEDGNPIEGAKVEASGYDTQVVLTAADGTFAVNGLLIASVATLNIHRYMMADLASTVMFGHENAIDLGDVTMTAKRLAPAKVEVNATNEVANIVWEAPKDFMEYRHDSGVYDGRLGNVNGTENSVYGAVFTEPARLESMSWYTDKYLQEHPAVNVFVLDLDNEGKPTSTVLFSQKNVANTDNSWNTFTFPEPVEAPRGYMLAVSAEGHVGLGLAEATDEYPFTTGVNCYSDDYRTGAFSFVEEHNIERQLMIRATGVALADEALAQVVEPKYELYRFGAEDKADETKWTKLTQNPIAVTAYADADWATLPSGGYHYAVKAVYAGGDASEAQLSDVAYCNMMVPFAITVTTNTASNESAGATVTMKGQTYGNEYAATADSEGRVTIAELWRDNYDVTVAKRGFVTAECQADFSSVATAALDVQLKEYTTDPFGLEVSTTGVAGERKLVWNTPNYLFDDFEGHTAFAVNSPGTIGWTYIDDSHTTTLPIDGVDYPHAGEEMAFQVFNPYETDPVLGVVNESIRPHSGRQFLASFAKSSADVYNNDFIISPELSFAKDFTLKFYAKSLNEDYGMEKMNVGYSTTGNAAADFTWLNGDTPVELPMGEWQEYRYTVPAEAKYVAINCVSDYLMMMMVDDVFVGIEIPEGVDPDNIREDLTFEVYLDGVKVADQAERSYMFSKLQNGTHRAGVKAMFHSAPSPIVETEFTVTDGSVVNTVAAGAVKVYPNPTTGILNVAGDYDRVEILNVAGVVVARYAAGEAIDIAGNPEGIYFARVISGDNASTTKVILKK